MNQNYTKKLAAALDKALVKKQNSERQAALAISQSGQVYSAGCIESDAKLLYISAIMAALARAAQSLDYKVERIIVMREDVDKKALLTPIDQTVMVDFIRRTGLPIALMIIDTKGTILLESNDVRELSPYYQPEPISLDKVTTSQPSPNQHHLENDDPVDILKRMAIEGANRSFTTYNSASSYGSAVQTKKGNIYFSGQYSSFDHRSMLHAEMGAVLAALSAGDTQITDLALVSTNAKYAQNPCAPCACCLQFLSEVSERLGLAITLHTHALKNTAMRSTTLEEYLPIIWSNT